METTVGLCVQNLGLRSKGSRSKAWDEAMLDWA